MEDELGFLNIKTRLGDRKLFFRRGTSDQDVIHQVFERHDYEIFDIKRSPEFDALLARYKRLGRTPLIVDAGANMGASAVFFTLMCPDAKIVAIEPEGGNFDLLKRNVEGLNVRCVHGALSSSEGSLEVVDPGEGHWGMRTAPVGGGGKVVPSVTVSGIYEEELKEGNWPFITKIDIEGFERTLFESHTEWVGRTPIMIVELHDWMLPREATSRTFLRCVADQDRDFVFMGENVLSIKFDLETP